MHKICASKFMHKTHFRLCIKFVFSQQNSRQTRVKHAIAWNSENTIQTIDTPRFRGTIRCETSIVRFATKFSWCGAVQSLFCTVCTVGRLGSGQVDGQHVMRTLSTWLSTIAQRPVGCAHTWPRKINDLNDARDLHSTDSIPVMLRNLQETGNLTYVLKLIPRWKSCTR